MTKKENNKTSHTIQQIFGSVGEFLVKRDLESNGFEVGIYGKAMQPTKSAPYLKPSGATIFDEGIGYSQLYYHPLSERDHFPEAKNFDYTIHDVKRLADICCSNTPCVLANSKKPPCVLNEYVFEPKSWSTRYPGIDELYITNQLAKGFLLTCQQRLQEVAIRRIGDDIAIESVFIRDNQRVNRFISAEWLNYNAKFKDSKVDINGFPPGHPGRYDFIALKNGIFRAVEVKVNSSKLSHWQKIRLGMLQKMGHLCIVAKVRIDKSEKNNLLSGNEPTNYEIEYEEFSESMELPGQIEFEKACNQYWEWNSQYFSKREAQVLSKQIQIPNKTSIRATKASVNPKITAIKSQKNGCLIFFVSSLTGILTLLTISGWIVWRLL